MSTNALRAVPAFTLAAISRRAGTGRGWCPGWAILMIGLGFGVAHGQEAAHPLKPPDRSNPAVAIRTFLEAGDALGDYLAREYIRTPSRAGYRRVTELGDLAAQSLDLSAVPAAVRAEMGQEAATALYEILCRLDPGFPDTGTRLAPPPVEGSGTNPVRWVIPNTRLALHRVPSGPQQGEFLFTPESVARAESDYRLVHHLAYTRDVPLEGLHELLELGGGWLVAHTWVQDLPAWLKRPFVGQAVWKWVSLAIILGLYLGGILAAARVARWGDPAHPVWRAVAQVALPAYFLLATPALSYIAIVHVNLRSGPAESLDVLTTVITCLAIAWIAWRLAPVFAEAILASPAIAPESIDAHLIRITTRLGGILVGAGFLASGADRLGVPVYGIIAGLGVGGLAIALAAQPTIENLIGGLNLFADKPVRVGDLCRCGDTEGTVESIGIRSTRVRGADRSLTVIPNAELSKLSIVNLAGRDRLLIKTLLSLRHETTPEQLRSGLARLLDLLQGHPRLARDSSRVRLVGLGANSLDVEVVAYVPTRDWSEFLAVREDVLLRILEIVGGSLALPPQTFQLARDLRPDEERAGEASERKRGGRALGGDLQGQQAGRDGESGSRQGGSPGAVDAADEPSRASPVAEGRSSP